MTKDLQYYATDPKAMELLLEQESFSKKVWEPACGGGHLCEVLKKHGHDVKTTDIVDRGYPGTVVKDFFDFTEEDVKREGARDIITNPPVNMARQFAEQALSISPKGTKVAMFTRLLFLEGRDRQLFFKLNPPKVVYVSSGRIACGKDGVFTPKEHSAVAYAWFIWEKGFKGEPIIKWFN